MEPHFGFCVHAGALWQQRSNHTHVTFPCRSMETHSTVLWGKQQVKNKITSKQTASSSVAIQMKTIELLLRLATDQTLVSDHSNENEYFQAELFITLYTVVAAF